MAEDKSTQTQYANPDTGEVPIAPKADIIRDNPYGSAPPPPPANTISIPETTITGRPINPTIGEALNPPGYMPPTGPLSQQAYNQYQVQSGETRKENIAQEGTNLSRGFDEQARVNHQAYVDQQFALFGNPEKLHQAQQSLAAAQALAPNDPNRQAQIATAQQEVMANEGARPALLRAMNDANRRDDELRTQIRQAQAQKIDPDRWWNSKSTEGKVLAGIGMILGGIGGGLAKTGRNQAMDVMNQAIDRDIDAQKHHIDDTWKAIAAQHGLNKDTFDRELHRQVWENNYRTSALENVKYKLSEAAAKTNSETVKNNAINAIQDITDQQMKIRNDQWRIAVSAQQAEVNRMRTLSKDADGDVQKLMEKEGVTYQDATDAVYSRPRYRELIGAGLSPTSTAYVASLKLQFASEMAKQQRQAALLGIGPGDPRYDRIIGVVRDDPKYAPVFRQPGDGGAIVPTGGAAGAERAKQVLDRTVNVNVYDPKGNIVGSQSKLAVNKHMADQFSAYQDSSPQFKAEYERLKSAAASGNVAQYEQARAVLIDLFPKFKFGSHNAPTESQKATAEDIIPTYTHWYSLGLQSRRDEKIKGIGGMIEDREKTIHRDTFGSEATAPPPPSGHGGAGGQPSGNVGRDGRTYGVPVK